ncbi:VirB4 family type IV secretion system protein [Microvirga sp. SRT01]|uniref:Type IV secretion system protein virB4 n=1 Tax=Sphingomonas longa TaxID=2778730 RepID=A0ABS2D2C4_9SPHN|nr:VirB4 family type IV secretion system protein [Microvirga sp. SRT01]MBM6575065.1 VirB4 family type IV secretion system protein [Sphingomonas sp. BT552]MBR7708116.1 VirB4 family type IV secretion system protein [Microvirga sp. SRT01]
MQLLPPLSRRKDAADRETSAGSRLPYVAQIDDHTILLRDGRLMQVVRLDGFLFETADSAELDHRKDLRDAMLQAIGSSRFALYHHIPRRPAPSSLGGRFDDVFSEFVDDRWRERLASRRLFGNELYVAIVCRPAAAGPLGGAGLPLLGGWRDRQRANRAAEMQALNAARDALIAALGAYGPHLLTSYDRDGVSYSEPLEYLAALYNGPARPVRLPEGDVGEYLPYRRISFGARTAELSDAAGMPRRFVGIVSIKEYPGRTAPGMLDDLMRLPFDMTVSQSFAFAERGSALSRINLSVRRMRAADDEAIGLRAELEQARDAVASGRAAFGEHHLTIAVNGESAHEVDAGCAEIQAALSDLGIIAVREDIGLEAAFWAQMPGNFAYIARRGLVSSRNFASLASWHNFPVGRATDNHWGDAVAILETTAAGPYHFNFHDGDLGNFTIIGPSGSGKTVVLNFLLAQARRHRPRIAYFDKDRGSELFLRSIGGHYDVLRPGQPAGLKPLALPDSAVNRRFLLGWLTRLLAPDRPLSAEESATLREAIEINMAAAPEYRRMSAFAQLLRGSTRPDADDLYTRLQPWWGRGQHAWLFDNADDAVSIDAEVVGFDMTHILDDPITRTPAMMYLFHRIEERLDGTPTIIVVDEGWKALDDDAFVAQIRDWEKTIRKRNGIVGFATQSAEDALSSRIASAIVEQAATQIFMPNPKARVEDYCDGFGLSRHEHELVRSMPASAHAFLIRHGRHSVVARLDLGDEPEMLTILSGRETTVRRLDALRAQVGDDPVDWMPRLLKTDMAEASA